MVNYPVEVEERDVAAAGTDLRVSKKKAKEICKVLNRKRPKFKRTKDFVEGLLDGTEDVGGKTYDSAAEEILKLLENAEANAQFKGVPTEKLRLKTITVEPGTTVPRARRRWDFGNRLKTAHIKVVFERG